MQCPCHSGRRYAACCKPLHEGARPASTPGELMRARYAAFARGLGAYLVDTLATSHELLAHDRAELVRSLSRAKDSQRFLGLRVDEEREEGDRGEVLFVARVFARGRDASFAELSSFVREGGAWRYASGITVDARGGRFDDGALTSERLLRIDAECEPVP